VPPFVKKILEEQGISIEEFMKNPDLQEKLKGQIMERAGREGSRNAPPGQPMKVEIMMR